MAAVRPVAARHDRDQTYPWTVQKALKEAGLTGVWIPREYGGEGGGVLNLCLVVEELSRACGGVGVAYAVNALGSFPILLGGTGDQKKRWLPPIAAGDRWPDRSRAASSASGVQAAMHSTASHTTTRRARCQPPPSSSFTLHPSTHRPSGRTAAYIQVPGHGLGGLREAFRGYTKAAEALQPWGDNA